jgi:hypothetical protein
VIELPIVEPGTKPLSLRAYARRRGVSPEAVSKAVSTGRLRESVTTVDGAPKIADPEVADREWEANSRQRVDPAPAPAPNGTPDYHASRALREAAAARREATLADQAELDLAERRGQLIDAEDARCDRIAAFSLVKQKLLAVPSQVAQRLPHLAIEVEPVIDELIREALQELSQRAASSDGG